MSETKRVKGTGRKKRAGKEWGNIWKKRKKGKAIEKAMKFKEREREN